MKTGLAFCILLTFWPPAFMVIGIRSLFHTREERNDENWDIHRF